MSTSSYGEMYKHAEAEGKLGGAAELLPEGPYRARVVRVKIDNTPDLKKFGLQVEVTEGPQAGKRLWANVALPLNLNVKNASGRAAAFFITMQKFGLGKDFFFRTPPPSDNEVSAILNGSVLDADVTHRDWNGKTMQNVNISNVVADPTPGVAPSVAPSFNPLGASIN